MFTVCPDEAPWGLVENGACLQQILPQANEILRTNRGEFN
jgi:hypothetical protein